MIKMETPLCYLIQKYIYNDSNVFIVSLWITDSHFNNEEIKFDDIKLMNDAYGSSG